MSKSPTLKTFARVGALAAAGTLALTLGIVYAGGASADPVTVDPLAGVEGFNTVSRYGTTLASTEMEGPAAVGGDLTLLGGYNIAAHSAGQFTAPGENVPSALVVAGGVDWPASSGYARVLNGYVKIGDLAGTDVLTKDMNQASRTTRAVPAGAGYDANVRVETTVNQPAESVGADTGLDFEALFADFERRSDLLASCEGAGVLNLTGAELNALAEFKFATAPSAANPVVINVDTTATGGVFEWRTPNMPGIGSALAPYIIWNFPDATELTITGGDSVEGTIYAPRADFTDKSPSNVEGAIVAATLSLGTARDNGGEVHHHPFTGSFECEGEEEPGESPSEDESTTPGEETPSEDESTTPGEETPTDDESTTPGEETPSEDESTTPGEETPTEDESTTPGEETPSDDDSTSPGEETSSGQESPSDEVSTVPGDETTTDEASTTDAASTTDKASTTPVGEALPITGSSLTAMVAVAVGAMAAGAAALWVLRTRRARTEH
ncbi:choice-of-anchor A family protein [Glycomyces sp. NRRL B-16210]|uniref:choice-of-anchor A family protein n=1 Tax=Glycomyces sp. NRRL B-16210 TaxID=1463821 RepID=UPI0006892112|nr:choice-of-anchor A family protein [Glycomyces sp. NRRL B-16210]